MQGMSQAPFTFGIYPFGAAGTAQGLASGRPDDIRQIGRALGDLGGGKQLLPRTYVVYGGPATADLVLRQIGAYVKMGQKWDMVLRFADPETDLGPWASLIRAIVRQFGKDLAALQITNEANLLGMPGSADGSRPEVRRALVVGVLAARTEIKARGASVRIGFNVVPALNPNDDFWRSVREMSAHVAGNQDAFAEALDYVGYDIYPDVFGSPIRPQDIGAAVMFLIQHLREVNLPLAGISTAVPIRICENGWPTAGRPDRSEEKQAAVLELVIRAIYNVRRKYNVTHYELFALRDADSSKGDLFHRFGIVRDDYSRKPAFDVYRKLIAELD